MLDITELERKTPILPIFSALFVQLRHIQVFPDFYIK